MDYIQPLRTLWTHNTGHMHCIQPTQVLLQASRLPYLPGIVKVLTLMAWDRTHTDGQFVCCSVLTGKARDRRPEEARGRVSMQLRAKHDSCSGNCHPPGKREITNLYWLVEGRWGLSTSINNLLKNHFQDSFLLHKCNLISCGSTVLARTGKQLFITRCNTVYREPKTDKQNHWKNKYSEECSADSKYTTKKRSAIPKERKGSPAVEDATQILGCPSGEMLGRKQGASRPEVHCFPLGCLSINNIVEIKESLPKMAELPNVSQAKEVTVKSSRSSPESNTSPPAHGTACSGVPLGAQLMAGEMHLLTTLDHLAWNSTSAEQGARNGSQSNFWYNTNKTQLLGVLLAITGNFLISISLNIQKYAHLRLACQANQKPYYTSKLWWCGIILMGLGELGNAAAYGFAPATLIAPLGCVSVIGSAFISVLFLKETMRAADMLGGTLTIAGTYLLVTFAPNVTQELTATKIQNYLISWQFLIYV
ncbi:hypothetical protein KIL84_011964, partial [Mauremys mutica]